MRRSRLFGTGYSLLELVLALAVLGVLVAGFSRVYITFIRNQNAVGERAQVQQSLARALEEVGLELRSATQVIDAADDEIEFRSQDGNKVRVYLSGGALVLEGRDSIQRLQEGVSELRFWYSPDGKKALLVTVEVAVAGSKGLVRSRCSYFLRNQLASGN